MSTQAQWPELTLEELTAMARESAIEPVDGRYPIGRSDKVQVGHCRDCRHWGGEGPTMGANSWWQTCQRANQLETKVMLSPSDPYVSVALMTRRDFGCVQFQPREGE